MKRLCESWPGDRSNYKDPIAGAICRGTKKTQRGEDNKGYSLYRKRGQSFGE